MCDDQAIPIVIDHGTHTSKAGFAGEDSPRAAFPSIVGVPQKMEHVVGWRMKDTYVGDEAKPSTDILNSPLPPLQCGIITNWDSMERIWFHIFYNELRVAPEDHPVLLTEVPLNPKYNRQRMTEIMFETFNCPALYVRTSAVLSLYASGRTTGIVLESGQEVTHAVPVYEGYAIPFSTTRLCYGGSHLTKYFRELIDKTPENTHIFIDKHSLLQMKEKTCFVADDFQDLIKSFTSNNDVEFELPDGKKITIGNERFICPEALFKPKCLGFEAMGIHEAIYKSIMMSDEDIRKLMFANIVLTGGNTMFKGLPSRIEREISSMDSTQTSNIKVIGDDHRNFQAWIGGSILASTDLFTNLWISKGDYQESGPCIVDWKCF